MNINAEILLQSPFLYLQAAGSDFSDFSARGIHLRWQLRGVLGDHHLPKGELANLGSPYHTNIGYNKDDDYVHLFKAHYKTEYYVDISLLKPPTKVEELGNTRKWIFENEPVYGLTSFTSDVEVRFMDIDFYDDIRATISPMQNPSDFIQKYDGVMEVQVKDQLMFKACVVINAKDDESFLEIETISVPDLTQTNERYISCRERIQVGAKAKPENREMACVTCENMEYIRFRCNNAIVRGFRLVTYRNTYIGYQRDWVLIDKFSLNDNDKIVQDRLDNPLNADNEVNNQWPKYNDVDLTTGAFTVSVNNYTDRWIPASGENGLKYALDKYLTLSKTDLLAVDTAPSGNSGDSVVNEFSYLQILNILATDYHVARMFGLGHIDQMNKEQEKEVYIYQAIYQTKTSLGTDYPDKLRNHCALSLPTTQLDYRLPPKPLLKEVTYGLNTLNNDGSGSQITLPGGYTPDGFARFVNINMQPFPHQQVFESFFEHSETFCMCKETRPILYGLEYRHHGEANYRQPEILHDGFYFDKSGLPETLPIPEQNEINRPIFSHRETEEGKHHYALYSINWFSRTSALSNDVVTDITTFSRRPLPPINLMTQFIQAENQLIFTTAYEQTLLSAIAGADKSLARVTFEWNQVHNDAYQFADEVDFLIRKQSPLMVKGKVTSVSDLPNNQALIVLGPYLIASSNPPQNLQPNVPAALASSFQGGILAAGTLLFEIVNVSSTGNNPSFAVKKILQRTSVEDPSDPGSYIMSETYKTATVNDLCTANQNLSQLAQWDAVLDKKVRLEKFFPLQLSASSDSNNNKNYTVQKVIKNGPNTEIFVKENIPNAAAATPGTISYKKYIKYFETIHSQKAILINENLSGELSIGDQITLKAAGGNSGVCTISNIFFANHFTRIETIQPLPDVNARAGVIVFIKNKIVNVFNGPAKKLIINAQDLTKELIPAFREFYLIDEGENVHEFVIGGIYDEAEIVTILDTTTGLESGAFQVTLNNFVLTTPSDSDITWYKGSIRIEEDPANFPPIGSLNYRSPEIKVLQIWSIDISGAQTKLIAYDTTYNSNSAMSNPQTDYMPIRTGNNIKVNVHPGYRVYLNKSNANASNSNGFKSSELMPAPGEGIRRTLLAARAIDSIHAKDSAITAPVVLLAQEIITPEPPGIPMGATFATRPDVYGKSTYTFDINVNTSGGRQPYAIVCYRANIRKVLSVLYLPATIETILTSLKTLPVNDAAFFNSRFHDLVNTDYDIPANKFRAYVANGFRFPIPDNYKYVIPNPNKNIIQKPFNGIRTFGQNFTVNLFLQLNGTPVTIIKPMSQIIKDAIDGAFLSLTEQPILYKYIQDGRITSAAKPKVRDTNGDMIVPGNPINFNLFDPFPMAVKFVDGAQTKVRFTDYTLDGASDTHYFYYAAELNSKFEVSDRSPVAGPISMVNTMPAEQPAIKEIISTPADTLRKKGPKVSFKINEFISSEKIKRVRIYRATNHRDAASVRNMSLAKELAVSDKLIDDFAGVVDLPYAEPLFYRIVALREITNEQGLTEYVPSKPSEISLTNIIDIINPQAPILNYTSNPYLESDVLITNIILSWKKTVHNGKYILFKLNESGNWTKIHELISNLPNIQVPLIDTALGSDALEKLIPENKKVFHHFKVVAVNSSNLLSLEEMVLTI